MAESLLRQGDWPHAVYAACSSNRADDRLVAFLDEQPSAEGENERDGQHEQQVGDTRGAGQHRLVQIEACRFHLLEHGFDLEPELVIPAGHLAQLHVGQQRDWAVKAFAFPKQGVVAPAAALQEDDCTALKQGEHGIEPPRFAPKVHLPVQGGAQDELPAVLPAEIAQALPVELAIAQQHYPALPPMRQYAEASAGQFRVGGIRKVPFAPFAGYPYNRYGVLAPDDGQHERSALLPSLAAVHGQGYLAALRQPQQQRGDVRRKKRVPAGPFAHQPALGLLYPALALPAILALWTADAFQTAALRPDAGAYHARKHVQPAQVVALGGRF